MPRHAPSQSLRPAASETSTTVAIRLRPLNDREKEGKQNRIWRCVPTHNSVTQTSPDGNPLPDGKGTFFTYDRIFDEDSSTEEVYDGTAKEIVESVSRGMNGTIFAYGQTSSGKTFTMQGGGSESTPGIVQIATRDLFRLIQEKTDRMFLMRVSYLEIYQEEIRDLLNPENTNMQVREDPRKGVYIDAHEETVGNFDTVIKILKVGEKQRHVGCTEMNSRSSRSHTIFRLVLESQQMYNENVHASPEEVDQSTLVATLNLVDLAGSESVRHTGATGIRQKEGGMINQSLLTLSRVIQTLTQPGHSHVNYRDSKLTRILQPSLSGNARMAIICCATAAEGFLEETRSTLQFASRAKEIKTRAVVNEVVDDKTQIRRMSQELAALKKKHAEEQAQRGDDGNLVVALQQEKAEQADKIDRLKKLLLNIAPAVAEEGEPLAFHLDVSPRVRRGKRARDTWCPGRSAGPHPLRLLKPNAMFEEEFDEDGSQQGPKRRSSEAAAGATARGTATPSSGKDLDGGVTAREGAPAAASVPIAASSACDEDMRAMASKLEEALAAKKETDEEMKEFVAYTEDIERALESTKALLAKQVEAAQEAAAAAAAATAAAGAATAREQESTMALEERIAALEADKAELEEQEAILRAENEEAAAIMSENQTRVPLLANADAQTDAPDYDDSDGVAAGDRGSAAGRSVTDLRAEIVERDCALEEIQGRVGELEGKLSAAKEELREQGVRRKEERQKADESLLEALAAKRRAEDAFSVACQSELEMRCRLESAEQQVRDTEEAALVSRGKKQEEIAALENRVAETDARLQAAEQDAALTFSLADQTKAEAAEEVETARRKVLALEAASVVKDKTIQELRALADRISSGSLEAESRQDCSKTEGEGNAEQLEEKLVADKNKALEEAATVRSENEVLVAKIEALTEQLSDRVGELESSKANEEELDAMSRAATAAEATAAEDMARVVAEAMESSEQLAIVQCELETKTAEAAKFAEAVEFLESQLKTFQDAASEKEAADAARVGGGVSRSISEEEGEEDGDLLVKVKSDLTMANGLVASMKETMAENEVSYAARVAEVENELASAKESLASAQVTVEEQKATDAVRIAELESELVLRKESLASAQSMAEEREAGDAARITKMESELELAKESLASAQATAEEREAASAARVAEVETELELAKESLASAQATAEAQEAVSAARVTEMESELASAKESLASAQATAEEREAASAARVTEVETELELAKESLGSAQVTAGEREAASATRIAEVEGELSAAKEMLDVQHACSSEADEAQAARVAELEAELKMLTEARGDVDQLKATLAAKDEEITRLEEQAAYEVLEAQKAATEAAAASSKAVAVKDATIAKMKESFEAVEVDLSQAMEDSESLSKTVLELTDQLVEKGAELAHLREQIEARTNELADVRAAAAAATSHNPSAEDSGGETAESSNSPVVRRLRVDLDKKGSELDIAIKERERASAELKEIKDMLGAAASAAGAAGATEDSLRKRVSQLMCENGLLKGEMDRHQALAAQANEEASSNISRSAAEVERLKREVERLSRMASEASGVAADRDLARSALSAMEAKLTELRQERTELQEASQRSLDRYSEAEAQVESLKSRVAELEACDSGRDAVVTLEIKVDELEEEVRRAIASKTDSEREARESANRAKRLQGQVEMMRSEYEVISEEASGLRGSLAGAEAKLEEALAQLESATSEVGSKDRSEELEAEVNRVREQLSELENTHLEALRAEKVKLSEMMAMKDRSIERSGELEAEVDRLGKQMSELENTHLETLRAGKKKLSEMQAIRDRSVERTGELEAEVSRLGEEMSELENTHLETLRAEQEKRSVMQEAHDAAVVALEGKAIESLELAEQIAGDQDDSIAALKAEMEEKHKATVVALKGEIIQAAEAIEARETLARELSEKCDVLTAKVKRAEEVADSTAAEVEHLTERLGAVEEDRTKMEKRLSETVAAGNATEEQLRHRLTTQVAEAEDLRQKLIDTRERSEKAESAVRASEQRARENADVKTKKLLVEMENLCQEKLIAENKAGEMEAELGRLREEVATAGQTAAKEQGMLIRAAEERMAVLDKAAQEKDMAIARLESSLEAALASVASSSVTKAGETKEALKGKIADLEAAAEEYTETIKAQDARIKKLVQVRLTNGQVEKLQAMKASAKKTAAENVELKQRLSLLEKRLVEAAGSASGGGDASVTASASNKGEDAAPDSMAADLAAARERNAELQRIKDTLMEKMKEYGKRVYELEKEHARVRAAVEELGGSVPNGGDLGDAVLDCAERFVGRGDASMMSTDSHDEVAAAAAAAAAAESASEELRRELRQAREALQEEEAGRAVLKEQMLTGVAKFRALEAEEKSTRERLRKVEVEQRATVSAAVKAKEKDHERQVKFLQEENLQLFNEITACKAQTEQLKAEVTALKEKLEAIKTAQPEVPASASKKRALVDRTNSVATAEKRPEKRTVVGKPGMATPSVPGVQSTVAAERRAASRALIEGEGAVNDEGPGECNQS